jgi:aminoglycoside phosphotransferase family enzyme/predicted kinase
MEPSDLIHALSDPGAYPHAVQKVQVRQTHISIVFLAGSYAYKIKKPVNMGFLDFTSLEKRRHFCDLEVRLNRRLAPTVYLGVEPVSRTPTGVKIQSEGEVIEWAVKMRRLPEEATLLRRLGQGQVNTGMVENLARKVASFHLDTEGGEHIAAFGRFEVVARNARENFEQASPQVGTAVSGRVFERLRAVTEQALARFQPLIEARADAGLPRDTHGDLHLDHVYVFPERQPPADLVIVDCIEFNERFRFADPVSDMAFVVMDLHFHGRRDLAQSFANAYFRARGDEQGRELLPFYTAYRAAVRGKVEGLKFMEKEVAEADRLAALARARGHWLLALSELEEPGQRPCLVLIGGLPGTGKSTLARRLAEQAAFSLIRSDLVRKELAGVAAQTKVPVPFGEGLYAPEWTERTYAECRNRAERLLFEGQRVMVDASFVEEDKRRSFLELGSRLALPVLFIQCQADTEVVRLRLRNRHGDASDADWQIYQEAAKRWEEPGSEMLPILRRVESSETEEQTLAQALKALRDSGLSTDHEKRMG